MASAARKRPTINDVARLAKVSTATVSRALQQPDVVSESTRRQVFNAVEQTGYRPNSAAKTLRQNRSGTILVVLPDIGNPFFAEILSGIEDAATQQDHTMLIGNTNGQSNRTKILLDYLHNGRADGALLLNGDLPLTSEQTLNLPLVSISEEIPEANISHVGTDNITAAMEATQHLITLGHQAITHFSGPDGNVLSRQRKQGYEAAMKAAGLERLIHVVPSGFTLESGKQAITQLLQARQACTAIVCANDESAMGAITKCKSCAVRVPEDLSVIGFDDLTFSRLFSPALSTVRQSRKETGLQAMKLLLKMIAEGPQPPQTLVIAHQLIERDSTVAPIAPYIQP